MDTNNDRTPSEQPQSVGQPPVPKKRFHLEKLEERIAPSITKGKTGSRDSGGFGSGGSSGFSDTSISGPY